MRILLVANGYPPTAVGGVEGYTAGLAKELTGRGHLVSILCAENRPDLPDFQLLRDKDGAHTVFRLVNNHKQISSFDQTFAHQQAEAAFLDIARLVRPELVHFNHLLSLSARLPLVAAAQGIRSIFTAHDFWAICQRVYLHDWRGEACAGPAQGGDCYRCLGPGSLAQVVKTRAISLARRVAPYPLRVRVRGKLIKDDFFLPLISPTRDLLQMRSDLFHESLSACDRILTPSTFVKRALTTNGYDAERIDVVPLGITRPLQEETRRPIQTPIRLAFVGSILPWKGCEVLIRAFKLVPHANLRLSLYGRDDIVPAYARALHELAAGDTRITFAGPFQPEEKERVYGQIDVLVTPSLKNESFSLVAREALVRGIPVIASRLGALPEIISHGVNGYLTPAGDVPALTNLLRSIAFTPSMLDQLTLPGPTAILTVQEHVERVEKLYYRCLTQAS